MKDILEILENGRIDWSDEHQTTTTIVTKNERLAIAEIKKLRARIAELEAALDHMHKGHDALVAYIAELDAEVRFAYLECEDAVRYYDYEADLLETDVGGLLENMRHMIKGIRDTAIPKNRYQNITDNKAAWQRMLAARNALKRKKVKAKGDP